MLSLSPSIAQPRLHALLNQRALELSHSTDDLKHEPAGRRAEIQVVAETHEGYAARLELRECARSGPVSRRPRSLRCWSFYYGCYRGTGGGLKYIAPD